VVVVVVVDPFAPLGTSGFSEASLHDDSAACQTHLPASSETALFQVCFGLPVFLGSQQIPVQSLCFNGYIPLPQSMTDQSPFSLSNL
jgi:hypothetical protein